MKNNGHIIIIVLLAIAVIALGYKYLTKGVCYNLPTDHDPTKFGPSYWKSIHSIVDTIPCPTCRKDGKSLFVFAHDLVNIKTGKPIFDQENFDKWIQRISDIKDGKKWE